MMLCKTEGCSPAAITFYYHFLTNVRNNIVTIEVELFDFKGAAACDKTNNR